MSAALLLALALPVAMLLACTGDEARARMLGLLWLAPLPALGAAFLTVDAAPIVLDPQRLQFTLALDRPGALLLGVVALLWSAAGAYARTYLHGDPRGGRFAVWWLLTLTGSLAVFFTRDLASFYLAFALVSLAAYGLVVHDGTARARRAGVIYLFLAVLGEIALLAAFALLATASPGDTLAIATTVADLAASPWRDLTVALLVAGFGLKAGLVPLHVWLPIAHPAAPMPGSAVLSGAIIKAGIIGLIRFLPFDGALSDWSPVLAALGLVTAYYAVAVGITQDNPKTVLAYSSVSQMGLASTVLAMGLLAGPGALLPAAFYAAHHVLAKGALFLAVGVAAASAGRRHRLVLLPALVLALGFGGLPLTGGGLAKLAVSGTLGDGPVYFLATLAGAGSTLLMLHFCRRLAAAHGSSTAGAPPGLALPWLLLAGAAIAVPWAVFLLAGMGTLAQMLDPKTLSAGLWPVLLGLVLTGALHRWGDRLPRLPAGDLVVLGEAAGRAAVAGSGSIAGVERMLRAWPVAGAATLLLV
ncbi:MAG: complex I subunit 5 family protein, partial [Geminicoccaceae bacterium]